VIASVVSFYSLSVKIT